MLRTALLLAGLVTALVAGSPSIARADAPLFMDGAETLYQKVITRTGARIHGAPDAGTAAAEPLDPFTILYVYERRGDWLHVGEDDDGAEGWIPADRAIDWKQTIVVAFNDPALNRRERTLLFRSREALEETICCEDVLTRVTDLRTAAVADALAPDAPVVSIEPELHVDIDDDFYIFPILQAEQRVLHFGARGRMLEVASVALQEPSDTEQGEFRAGVVFVIDTTTSMGPYIEGVRRAVDRIRGRLMDSEIADAVRFGLVGFRQSDAVTPALEYHTRTYLPLAEDSTVDRLSAQLATMRPSRAASPGFAEDSLGGIEEAVRTADLSAFQVKFLVLITDASPRSPEYGDTLTAMLPPEMNARLRSAGFHPLVFHLTTPQGGPDHSLGRRAYTQLARVEVDSYYREIQGGDVARFTGLIDGISDQMVGLASETRRNGVVADADPNDDSDEARLRRSWRAMQLSYLAGDPPDVFRAWMIDKALENPRRDALDIRVLMTKNQLATLFEMGERIIDTAQSGLDRLDPDGFFTSLREAVVLLALDPDRLARSQIDSLGDALGEYLALLPYDSPITSLTEDTWNRMTGGQQRDLLETLRSKVAYYRRLHDTPELWIALRPDAEDGERVTTIPLARMP
ncbi:vWA domain-containing protein [Salinarimonas chemoclinalis]|uniref:vWA domain-containing protein n=1 Tax=Salinarimonas chemoclinalis TaxID=3241599 RepID=UPI00355622C2